MHIGSFTPLGTFRGAIDRLDHLAKLGVTALEIMPIADFPGRWNWGYDGALLYAPDSTYGRPDDLKALVDAAHARGISVLLDVVYNHFGPDGNYLPVYAPQVYTGRHKTPWGDALNYDDDSSGPVRDFIIHNALYWIEEFHLDGLRLDAVHAIIDESPKHLLDELAERVRAATSDRPVHLVLENEENSASRLSGRSDLNPVDFTAQWNDDVHHTLHVAATGEGAGYYVDYLGDTEKLGRSLAEGFAFQGEVMQFRGSPRGEPSAHLPARSFRNVHPEPRSDWQPRFWRSPQRDSAEAGPARSGRDLLAAAASPDAVHGRGMGDDPAFPLLCDFNGSLRPR